MEWLLKTYRDNELPFLVSVLFNVQSIIGRAKRAPHWGVQSRFRVIYVYMLSVCLVCICQINCVGGIT